MIEIADIIELRTNSDTDRLSFATKYLVQANFTFKLTVLSNGFSGSAHFCARRDQLEKMCDDLKIMHSKLIGSTTLSDNDSDSFIRFDVSQTGQLSVSGQVGGSHEDQFLQFRFQTDQTCIPVFVKDFTSLINK